MSRGTKMVDIVEKSVRSRMMASVRGKDTKPELAVRRYLHSQGFRYRIHVRSLPGNPDLVLTKYRLVIFVHGCFWHRHPGCGYTTKPDDTSGKWHAKFEGTVSRDSRNIHKLLEQGWRVFVLWECGLTKGVHERDLEWLPAKILDEGTSFLDWPLPK